MAYSRKKIIDQARYILNDRQKLTSTIERAIDKMNLLHKNNKSMKELRDQLHILIKMLKSHREGAYKAFSGRTILLLAFALIYFITPTDAIPDFIPALGFSDDISLLYLIFRRLKTDIDDYLQWEGKTTTYTEVNE